MVRWREPQCKRISQYYLILCVYAFRDSIKKNSTQASRTELVVELRLRRISFVISEKNRKMNSAFSPCSFPFGQQYICVVLVIIDIKLLFNFCNAAINYFSSVFCFFFQFHVVNRFKMQTQFLSNSRYFKTIRIVTCYFKYTQVLQNSFSYLKSVFVVISIFTLITLIGGKAYFWCFDIVESSFQVIMISNNTKCIFTELYKQLILGCIQMESKTVTLNALIDLYISKSRYSFN